MSTRRLSVGLVAMTFLLQLVSPAVSTSAADSGSDSGAREVLERYLAMPHPEKDTAIEVRLARLEVLARLSSASNALAVIRSAWSGITDSRQRAELSGMIGQRIRTAAAAAMLTECLKDPAEDVRWQAVHGLRMMARRTDRVGGKRTVRRSDHPPEVEGLVPALIFAANDSSEKVRVTAMYALADARDPQATRELRKHLRDPSREVRLHAACFLTEFQDRSGLSEMSQALQRLPPVDPEQDFRYYVEAELLLSSLERITGKTRGEIPMNPMLSSNTREIEALRERYRELVAAWREFLSSDEGRQLWRTLSRVAPE